MENTAEVVFATLISFINKIKCTTENHKHLLLTIKKEAEIEVKEIIIKNLRKIKIERQEFHLVSLQKAIKNKHVLLFVDECLYVSDTMIEQVVDSGTSFYITPNAGIFTTYKVATLSFMKIENLAYCKIIGIGDVRHIPDISQSNLGECFK